LALLITLWAGAWAPSAVGEKEIVALDDDERLLEAAGLSSEGPGLLEIFKARARAEGEPGHIDVLLRPLSGPSQEERLQAGADLVAGGPLSISGLRRLANDYEAPETRDWAKRCLMWVEGPDSANLVMAAARLVARRKPAGAAEALLAYLPYADNEDVVK